MLHTLSLHRTDNEVYAFSVWPCRVLKVKKSKAKMRVNSSKRLEYVSEKENKLKNQIIRDKAGNFNLNVRILRYRSEWMRHVLRVEAGFSPKTFKLYPKGNK
jgi:hypothetical protein